ncbi:MAG: hypothetical protein H7257_13875 [Taibaiella sp.]|nr:hypothetical protein [Taibaiella sp.]
MKRRTINITTGKNDLHFNWRKPTHIHASLTLLLSACCTLQSRRLL